MTDQPKRRKVPHTKAQQQSKRSMDSVRQKRKNDRAARVVAPRVVQEREARKKVRVNAPITSKGSGGCVVTAFGVGGALLTGLAIWKGVA